MKRTVGLFVNTFYDEYEVSIFEGVKKAINEYDYNLISFIGGSLNNPYFNNITRNAIYELACSKNVDGILVISVSIGSYIDNQALQNFFAAYSPIPLVSIGTHFDDNPHVYIDNIGGMNELVTHLIKDHNYRRIAFIRGPNKNKDAEARFWAYKDILTKNKIIIDPNLIINGSFHVNIGSRAVSQLIDERKVSFDVIIGANDYVAINAISELQKRGIHVPNDIAVVGFDDVIESQYLDPPLTTVKQPAFELGYEAAIMMCTLLSNNKINMDKEIASQLIIRRSCGCDVAYNMETINRQILRTTNDKIKEKRFISALIDVMKIEFKDNFLPLKLTHMAERLFSSLLNELQGNSGEKFLSVLKNFVNKIPEDAAELYSWHTIICFLFIKISPELFTSNKSDVIFKLFSNSSRLIDSITIKNLRQTIVKANEREMHLYSVKKRLHIVLEVNQLEEIIRKEFPLLGIRSCYISVCHKGNPDIFTTAKLLIAYKNNKCINLEDDKQIFDSRLLLPGGIKNNDNNNFLIILSLNYKKELLGFVIYELEDPGFVSSTISFTTERRMCEILTTELSNTVKSIMLFNQVVSQIRYIKKNTYESEERSGGNTLPETLLQEYYQKLLIYMDTEKPFVDLDLTLPYLAEQLEIPRNHLSYVINKYVKVNFYSFVNGYRIEQAKQYLEKDCTEKINILEVACNSGFKSKSTFYKIFKEYTHVTPTDYRSNYIQSKKKV